MRKCASYVTLLAAVGAAGLTTACGDDDPSGPMFGDLTFTPSIVLMGETRATTLTLRNRGTSELDGILIGVDQIFRTTQPDSLCGPPAEVVTLAPSSVASLAAGEEVDIDVTLDLSTTTPTSCPPGTYDADIFAAVEQRILGGATLRFDWDGSD